MWSTASVILAASTVGIIEEVGDDPIPEKEKDL